MKSLEAAEVVREVVSLARQSYVRNIPAVRFDPNRVQRALAANQAGHVLLLPAPVGMDRDTIAGHILDALDRLNPDQRTACRELRAQILNPDEWLVLRVERLFELVADDLAEMCDPEVRQRLKVDIAAGAEMKVCPFGVNEAQWAELVELVPAPTIRKRLWSALADMEIRRTDDGGTGSGTRLRGGPRRFRSDSAGADGVGPASVRGFAG